MGNVLCLFIALVASGFSLSSIHPTTETKSDTKLGILHLTRTSLPWITYSSSAFVEYSWFTAEDNKTTLLCLGMIYRALNIALDFQSL